MVRHLSRHGCFVSFLLLAAVLVAVGGCKSALFTAGYLIRGTDVDAEFDGLRKKRVAVVCRPLVALKYRNSSVARDLAREIGTRLGRNVRKIDLVEHDKVAEWIDENAWDEFEEIGAAVDAEIVVGVDLERFSLYQDQTLYQGHANVSIKVVDCTDGGKVLFERRLPETVHPPNAVYQTSEKQEPQFRREFVGVLADQIARHFYPHDPHVDVARDTDVLR